MSATSSAPPHNSTGAAIWDNQRLIVRGGPGSGKTTLLCHLAVINALDQRGKAAQAQGNSVRELYGWPWPLLPIVIPLRRLAREHADWEKGSLLDAYEQVIDRLLPKAPPPPPGWFARRVARGGCLLLVDGFDELRDDAARARLAEQLSALERIKPRYPNHIVLTTRPVGYNNELHGARGSFVLRDLAPLNNQEISVFIEKQYTELYRALEDRRPPWQPQVKTANLQQKLLHTPLLLDLARTPLMLALITNIHANQDTGELPEERYRVYEDGCKLLIERWGNLRGTVVGDYPAAPASLLNLDEKLGLAARLAWSMLTQAPEPGRAQRAQREGLDSRLLISRQAACDQIALGLQAVLSGRLPRRGFDDACRQHARDLLSNLGAQGGLLQGETNNDDSKAEVQFAHKSLQEFLAAQFVGDDPNRRDELLANWASPDWREVLLLYAASRDATSVLRHLLAQPGDQATLLAGWCLRERPRHTPARDLQEQVRAGLRTIVADPARPPAAQEEAFAILSAIGGLEDPLRWQIIGQNGAPPVRAGCIDQLAAGQLDPAQRAVLAQLADTDSAWQVRRAAALAIADADPRYQDAGSIPALVPVAAGRFLMGEDKAQHELYLPKYWIGRTPVTNAQFRRFAQGDGYTNQKYWTDAGWRWANPGPTDTEPGPGLLGRFRRVVPPPGRWRDPGGADSLPVVDVTWFEAVAYCRWLSAQTGRSYCLPSEAEWEKAARGSSGQRYPWGDDWAEEHCNSEELGLQQTTPVGCFPAGASPCGALDMAGNVWEWCATAFGKDYPYQPEDEWSEAYLEAEDGDGFHRLRGGAFWSDKDAVRAAYRNFSIARYRNSSVKGCGSPVVLLPILTPDLLNSAS